MTNQVMQKVAIKIRPIQIKLELILLIAGVLGIFLREMTGGTLLTIISFSTLSILYYIMAYRINNPNIRFQTFINKLIQISFSVSIMGILFTIQNYDGAANMLIIGLLSSLLGLVGLFIVKNRDKEKVGRIDSDLIRAIIISITLAGLMLFGEQNELKSDNYKEKVESLNYINTDNNCVQQSLTII